MASILKVDALQGVTAAGDITITSEGGAATQSLQQGLTKGFLSFDFGSNTIPDSFNITSVTDRATGCLYGSFTNSMNNTGYAVPSANSPVGEGSMATSNNNRYCISSGDTTGRFSQNNMQVTTSSDYQNVPYCCATINGDLA
jgi:hypothetical protein